MAKVTVLMPTFNVSQYVKDAVESVLGQTYSDFELLVIDDCSSDNTIDIVRGIKDPRIRIERNERNLGLADNLNRGLSLIKTEYVARMDGDGWKRKCFSLKPILRWGSVVAEVNDSEQCHQLSAFQRNMKIFVSTCCLIVR